MKILFAAMIVIASAAQSNAQFYPSMSQLRQAPLRQNSRPSYGTFVQRGNQGFYFSGSNRKPSFSTYTQGRSTHVLQGNRRIGTIYRR